MSAPWYYISFADPCRFLGGCYVRAEPDPETEARAMLLAVERRGDGSTLDEDELQRVLALAQAYRLGIAPVGHPGGEAQVVGPIPDDAMAAHVPEANRERLLTSREVEL